MTEEALNNLAATVFALEQAVTRLEQRLTTIENDVRRLRREVNDINQRPLERRYLEGPHR